MRPQGARWKLTQACSAIVSTCFTSCQRHLVITFVVQLHSHPTQLLQAAKKYDCPTLQQLAERTMEARKLTASNICEFLTLADSHGLFVQRLRGYAFVRQSRRHENAHGARYAPGSICRAFRTALPKSLP